MSFFGELKRRNVFRVAAAYVVSAWLLIEVGNTLEETLHLPDWADTLLAFFLILGFPIALFVSWAYEITPEGIKREKDVEVSAPSRSATARKLNQLTVTVMALALVYFALDKWVFNGETARPVEAQREVTQVVAEPAPQAVEQAAPAEEVPSVAVLPFVNMSADPDNEYFSDGISEELLNLLVKVEGLRVPSRTSSFAFKGLNTDIKEIARQLEVGHILEGSVRKAGNKVRVTAQLIDVSTDTHLWSDTFDRELEDIFAIQDEIAGHIVDALQVVLGSAARASKPTENLEAYNLYLQGRHLFQQRGPGVKEAELLLLKAVELDPQYAQAWGTLAMTYIVFPNYLGMNWTDTRPQAMAAATRALAIDERLAEAKLALAQMAQRELRWAESLSLFEQVVAEHPRNALAYLWHGIVLLQSGYISEAAKQFQTAIDLDPVAAINLDWLSRSLSMSGQLGDSLDPASKSIQLGRNGAAMTILFFGIETGELQRATDLLEQLNLASRSFATVGLEVYQGMLTAEEATAIIGSGDFSNPLLPRYWENLSLYLQEDANNFYDSLREIYTFDDTIMTFAWWSHSRWFRQSAAMSRFVEDFNLLALWRERGWPDRCRPASETEFECD
jgi:TolB-like protein